MKFLSGILLLFLTTTSFAEYRVFLLKIYDQNTQSNQNADSSTLTKSQTTQSTDFRLVESHLDPIQYPYYHPTSAKIEYTETWRCYGRTNGKDYCPNPKTQQSPSDKTLNQNSRTPASSYNSPTNDTKDQNPSSNK